MLDNKWFVLYCRCGYVILFCRRSKDGDRKHRGHSGLPGTSLEWRCVTGHQTPCSHSECGPGRTCWPDGGALCFCLNSPRQACDHCDHGQSRRPSSCVGFLRLKYKGVLLYRRKKVYTFICWSSISSNACSVMAYFKCHFLVLWQLLFVLSLILTVLLHKCT